MTQFVFVTGGVVSSLGKGIAAASLAALRSAAAYLHSLISDGLRIRRVPALHFELDLAGERGTRIQQLLNSLEQGRESAGEGLPPLPLPGRPNEEHR